MYGAAAAGTVGGGLAMTGLGGNPVWMVLAGFALVAAGTAAMRLVPRRQG